MTRQKITLRINKTLKDNKLMERTNKKYFKYHSTFLNWNAYNRSLLSKLKIYTNCYIFFYESKYNFKINCLEFIDIKWNIQL